VSRAFRILSAIAELQHGVVAREQGEGRGLTRGEIDHAATAGAVITIAPGVYRLPGVPQSLAMATAAATLASGGPTSHATAARLLRLDAPLPVVPLHVRVDPRLGHPRVSRIDVADAGHAFFSVVLHRSRNDGESIIEVDGIPCTDAARTLIDIAPFVGADALGDAFDRARDLGLVSIDALARRFALLGGRGRPGTPKIRSLLEHAPPKPLQSQLERIAGRMLAGARLPQAVRQLRLPPTVGPYRLDFAWPDLLATFETEGFEWHGTRARWKQDRIRVAALERAGWRHMVGTWDDVVHRPDETVERVARMLAERRLLANVGALDVHCPLTRAGQGQRTTNVATPRPGAAPASRGDQSWRMRRA
jgi:very-short-patch-repair endonuclease